MTTLKTQLMIQISFLNKFLVAQESANYSPHTISGPGPVSFYILKQMFKNGGRGWLRGEEYVRDYMWQAKIKNIYLTWPFTEEI